MGNYGEIGNQGLIRDDRGSLDANGSHWRLIGSRKGLIDGD